MQTPRVLSIPERSVKWIPLPYWLLLIIFWELLFVIDYILGFSIAGGHNHNLEYGLLVLFFALVCITIVYCSKMLTNLFSDIRLFIDHHEGQLSDWYEEKLRTSYEGAWPIAFGLLFTLITNLSVGSTINQFTPANSSLFYLRLGYEYTGFFFLGLGIWALVNVLLIPIALTRFKIKVSLNQVPGRGLQALGAAYFKMSWQLRSPLYRLLQLRLFHLYWRICRFLFG